MPSHHLDISNLTNGQARTFLRGKPSEVGQAHHVADSVQVAVLSNLCYPTPMAKAPLSGIEKKVIELFGRYYGALNTRLYRATKGKVGGTLAGAPVLLLTTTGRKSGQARTTPLLYLRDGERYVVVASKGGFPTHPAWYLNLQQNARVQVEVGKETKQLTARTASAEEKARLWPALVAMYKSYESYQERTERPIPVVFLEATH